MYMPEGHNHEEWLQKKHARRNQSNSGGASQEGKSSDTTAKSIKLTLSEQMISCLMTKAGFSAEEADSLFKEMDLN